MEFLCLIHRTTPSTPSMLTFLPLSNTKLQGGPLEPFLQRHSLKFGPFDRAAIFDVLVRGERVAHGHKPNTNTTIVQLLNQSQLAVFLSLLSSVLQTQQEAIK